MYGENQDHGARIRRVPIEIESRDEKSKLKPKTRFPLTDFEEVKEPSYYPNTHFNTFTKNTLIDGNEYDEEFYNNDKNNQSKTLPTNTTNININYKPSRPTRQTRPPSYSSPSSSSVTNRDLNNQSSATNNQKVNNEASPDRNNPSPSSDKLVNSPEPIPLPPPPSEQNSSYNSTKKSAPKTNNKPPNNDEQFRNIQNVEQKPNTNQQQSKPQLETESQPSVLDNSPLGRINKIKSKVFMILQDIIRFNGITASSKDYRYLDEMLTRFILELDNIECGNSDELRQHRKSSIVLIEKATDILQRKLKINSDIHDLSEKMGTSNNQ